MPSPKSARPWDLSAKAAMQVLEVGTPRELKDFINLPLKLYPPESLYVPPLAAEVKKQLSTEKNPFFEHAEAKYFMALRDGRPVGRVAACVNDRHNEFHHEKTGFFGFFECADDPEAAAALLGAAAAFLAKRGMSAMRGPMSFSTNEECGMLLDGFDEPPMIMTPYNPPYYNTLVEGYGMRKVKDLYAYIYDIKDELPEKIHRAAAYARRRGITARPIRKDRFGQEMALFKEVYNSAWENNWGFIPLTDGELDYMGNMLKDIVIPELTMIAERDGEPVGFMGILPDFNLVLKKMGGKLNPVTILKALWYSRKIKDLRLLLLGIKKPYRVRGVDALMYEEAFKYVKTKDYRRAEFSWILEDNTPVKRIIEGLEARHYKTYRIYEMPLP